MAPETKKQAQEKLRATLNKIGFPDQWRDYSSVVIGRESYLFNREHAAAFEFQRWVNKISQPVDRTEWGMTPSTIDAYEDPQSNTINFPAGILQPPFFEANQDDAVSYGAIGAVIGHEIIHGYDDEGRKFDARGNLRDWWTSNDAKEYEARGSASPTNTRKKCPRPAQASNRMAASRRVKTPLIMAACTWLSWRYKTTWPVPAKAWTRRALMASHCCSAFSWPTRSAGAPSTRRS